MIKEVTIFENRYTRIAYELQLFAFRTPKGIFTLSASHSNGTDEWRELGSCNFHTWARSEVYNWFKQGKIEPIDKAVRLDWYYDVKLRTQVRLKSIKI